MRVDVLLLVLLWVDGLFDAVLMSLGAGWFAGMVADEWFSFSIDKSFC